MKKRILIVLLAIVGIIFLPYFISFIPFLKVGIETTLFTRWAIGFVVVAVTLMVAILLIWIIQETIEYILDGK